MSITYLVTGATGHLGNNVISILHNQQEKVRALVLPNDPFVKHIEGKCQIYYGDVTDKTSMEEFFDCSSKDDIYVIHCAGIVSLHNKFNQKVWDVNVVGTKNILDMCKLYHVKKMVYVSSVHAIPELPNNETITEVNSFDTEKVVGLYAKTKAAATQLVLQEAAAGLDVSIVHPSGIIGPNDYQQGHLTALIEEYINGRLPAGTDGGYDFVDARDVAQATINCSKMGKPGECYILSNHYCTIKELLDMAHEAAGVKPIKLMMPNWIVKMSSPIMGVYYRATKKKPLFTSYSIYTLQSNSHFSHEKATRELDYHPRSLQETINDTVTFLKNEQRA